MIEPDAAWDKEEEPTLISYDSVLRRISFQQALNTYRKFSV